MESEDFGQMSNLLNIKQVAELLNMSERTIYEYVADQKIPYVKIGKAVRFDPDKIENWVRLRTVNAKAF